MVGNAPAPGYPDESPTGRHPSRSGPGSRTASGHSSERRSESQQAAALGTVPVVARPAFHVGGLETRHVGLAVQPAAEHRISEEPLEPLEGPVEVRRSRRVAVLAGRRRPLPLRECGHSPPARRGNPPAPSPPSSTMSRNWSHSWAMTRAVARAFAEAFALPVEPGQDGHGQAVVVAVALAPQLAVAVDPFDDAVQCAASGARRLTCAARHQYRCIPAEREGAALGAIAQIVRRCRG